MKKSILILLILQSVTVAAQIRISDFKQSILDGAASDVMTALADPDGRLCAVLKLETKQSGWTFDAGLAGIMDTRYEDGIIWLYVPASAKSITVAHKEYGTLREWSFPVSLEPGRTYTMKLSYERPRHPVPAAIRTTTRETTVKPAPAPKPVLVHQNPFCNHFADSHIGCSYTTNYSGNYERDDEYWFGLSYTWIGERIGPYISLGTNLDESGSIFGGVAYRITDPYTASLDWQVYGGLGFMDGMFGLDVGTRFAWRSSSKLSHWDFGFGCQFTNGMIMPTVSVGLCIWGIPTLIGIGLVAYALGG
jgi:hypothetical protein